MKESRAGGTSVPERVSQVFYTHGVFCSAYPIAVLTFAVLLVLLSCIPLYWLPVPSNVPQLYTQGEGNDTPPSAPPRWFSTSPPIYIQQVIVKSVVSPWVTGLSAIDAIRAPLAQTFSLVETIENYQLSSGRSLIDLCTQVEEPNDYLGSLPQYTCLTVSPANLWRRNPQTFYSDPSIVSTIYKHNDAQMGKASLAEVLFGLRIKESGIKRYPLRSRQRVIQFSITVFLNELDLQYLDGLKSRLKELYPNDVTKISPSLQTNIQGHDPDGFPKTLVHVYYAGDFEYRDFLPLLLTYIILFFYMYFSVRKIELVRSKVGMALSAVFTVIASLLMSVGLCLMFGLDPSSSSRGREVFPYLVIVVGLENILVLTKSVVSTAPHLDAKIRIAQGLAREGWSITKNLLTEVTILTCGLFTLVPSIQEFCMFAIVSLVCDFFLQMCFFATALSLDIRGLEAKRIGGGFNRRSKPTVSSPPLPTPRHEPRPRSSNQSKPITSNIPKRLRIVYFWARTRIVQRMFMLCMVVWIGGFLYSADLISKVISLHPPNKVDVAGGSRVQGPVSSPYLGHASHLLQSNYTDRSNHVKEEGVSWGSWSRGLAPPMWCYLVAEYNTSGCRLAVLPPIRISSIVSPGAAARLTSPADPLPPPPWNPLADALDPIEFSSEEDDDSSGEVWGETPLLPSTPLELLLVTLLTTISVVVISYMALALYHCVCSRNYAQWRGSWGTSDSPQSESQVVEAMPVVLEGHSQAVEWVAADGNSIASCCLAGEINVWDVSSGELITHIDRKRFFENQSKGVLQVDQSDQMMSDYESGSPPPVVDSFMFNRHSMEARRPSLDGKQHISDSMQLTDYSRLISTDFTRVSDRSQPTRRSHGFDYALSLRLYRQERLEDPSSRYEEEDLGSLDSLEGDPSVGIPRHDNPPQIWCLDSQAGLVALGTAAGTVEFWHANTGQFKCVFDDSCRVGVTCVRLAGCRVVLARLTGAMEVLSLEWSWQQDNYSAHHSYSRRQGVGHNRCQSAGRVEEVKSKGGLELKVLRIAIVRAHQQPVTALTVEAGRILTASHDHTLKVFGLLDQMLVFTLHGHCGPVTHCFIDSLNPLTAGSASQDGMVCVWDLLTGACVFNVEGHEGAVTALTYSASYVISLGSDDRLCVWDRFQGHLLNTIHLSHAYCMTMVMLSHNLLVTSKMGCLIIWDVRWGEAVRCVKLGDFDDCDFVRIIVATSEGVVCDYGRQLRLIRFPIVYSQDKMD